MTTDGLGPAVEVDVPRLQASLGMRPCGACIEAGQPIYWTGANARRTLHSASDHPPPSALSPSYLVLGEINGAVPAGDAGRAEAKAGSSPPIEMATTEVGCRELRDCGPCGFDPTTF